MKKTTISYENKTINNFIPKLCFRETRARPKKLKTCTEIILIKFNEVVQF